jgi:hypothetical protein
MAQLSLHEPIVAHKAVVSAPERGAFRRVPWRGAVSQSLHWSCASASARCVEDPGISAGSRVGPLLKGPDPGATRITTCPPSVVAPLAALQRMPRGSCPAVRLALQAPQKLRRPEPRPPMPLCLESASTKRARRAPSHGRCPVGKPRHWQQCQRKRPFAVQHSQPIPEFPFRLF